MTPDQIATRIVDRIERDGTIHKSSIVEELDLCMGRNVARQEINNHLATYLAHRYGLGETWFTGEQRLSEGSK